MALFSIELQPGVYRNGTILQSQGRYYDTDLARFSDGDLKPVGGWRQRGVDSVTGKARAMLIWRDNDAVVWVAIGTHTGLFIMDRAGVIYDITPDGFVPGEADSTFRGGYGNWLYGRGAYGTARPDTQTPTEITVWSLDTWGEDLVGCTPDDGIIYEWSLNTGLLAAPVSDAPACRAVHVTADRIMMALGANGNPRRVAWSDQEDNTEWTPAVDNYAGDFDLQTPGRLMCGRRVTGGTLLFTDVDAHLATFSGQPLVYGFERKGTGCGIVSQNAVAVVDGRAFWMGPRGFWTYNNWVEALPCDEADYVFSDINRSQIQKATAWHNSDYGEITWFYPSKSSTEVDRYITYSYREGHWVHGGSLKRLCGTERGPLAFPLTVDTDGVVYEQEVGLDYGGATPFAETGPFLVGEGDSVISVRQIIPDEKTSGDVSMTVFNRFQPMGPEVTKGPFTLDDKVDVRFTTRLMRVRFTGARLADWRVGKFKLEGAAGGSR
jgi:hypothetical protein